MTDPDTQAGAIYRGSPLRWLLPGILLYYGAAKLGVTLFSLEPSNLALIWLPSGIGLIMCRISGWYAVPAILAASFAANAPGITLTTSVTHLGHTFLAAASNTLEAVIAWRMMNRYLPDGVHSFTGFTRFVGAVVLPATLLNGALLVANLIAGHYIQPHQAGSYLGLLLFSNSLGMIVIYFLAQAWWLRKPLARRQGMVWLTISAAALATVYGAFVYNPGLVFLVIPLLLYLVSREPNYGAYITLLVTICVVIALAHIDLGPFAIGAAGEGRLMLLAFLFTLTLLVAGMDTYHRDLARAIKSRESWEFKARHDPLTGLGNRLMFLPRLQEEIDRNHRLGRPFSLALVDIDHFKAVNDTHGHATGDQVLVDLAHTFSIYLRKIDVVARIGGEEFAVLFPEARVEQAAQAMQRLRGAVEGRSLKGGGAPAITLSCGVVECPGGASETVDSLLQKADERLYQAKNQGRNRVVAAP